jgi:pilus assembly protein CpaF
MTITARAPELVDRVRDRLVAQGRTPTPATVAEAVRAEGGVIGDLAVHRLSRELRDELVGLGPLQRFVDDERVTDILVNAPDDVWIDRGLGLEPVGNVFADAAEIRRLAVRLAAAVGRRLDDASPCADIRIAGGLRLHAVLPPISARGPVVSLRIPRHRGIDLQAMERAGGLGEGAVAWLEALMESRAAFLVSGGTGTGKTTLLGALLAQVPSTQRIVIVEDSAELAPQHPHVVSLEARHANVDGAGAVTMRELVRHSLRMRPDRLVVGEARGEEVVDLLAALNTGHEGGCGTVHANAIDDVPARIAALAAVGGLARDAAMEQLGSAVHALVHLDRGRDGVRRLRALGALDRRGASVIAVEALRWGDDGRCHVGPGLELLRQRLDRR